MEEGGLSIKDIRKLNVALLTKLKWMLLSEGKGKWKYILLSKYGRVVGRGPLSSKLQSRWWRDMYKSCGEEDEVWWFQGALEWKVVKGDNVKFWEDVRCGGNSLQSLYPRLYVFSLDQRKLMGEEGGWENVVWRWRLNLRIVRFRWEEEQVDDMLKMISRVSLNKEVRDFHMWGVDASKFSLLDQFICASQIMIAVLTIPCSSNYDNLKCSQMF